MKVTPYHSSNLPLPAENRTSLPLLTCAFTMTSEKALPTLRPRIPSLLSDNSLILVPVFWGFILCELSFMCGVR